MEVLPENINVAVLLTCFNRREKTIKSLSLLYAACDEYNRTENEKLYVDVFLTDDGCSDGTSDAVLSLFGNKSIEIIFSDGNAYWAGGMRLAWRASLNKNKKYDFFLLINDDTELKHNCFNDLMNTHRFSVNKYGKSGVYTGFVSKPGDENKVTYGAKIYSRGIIHSATLLKPTGVPQKCSLVNANILLVSKNVVEHIGILDDAFIHGGADMDYGMRAVKSGLPVLTSSYICGYCENDHDTADVERDKVQKMTLKERRDFLRRPNIKQYHDGLVFFWRYNKIKYILLYLSYFLNLFCPSLYYNIYKKRGH